MNRCIRKLQLLKWAAESTGKIATILINIYGARSTSEANMMTQARKWLQDKLKTQGCSSSNVPLESAPHSVISFAENCEQIVFSEGR